MKIKWLAHAAFLITADSGSRIITDPYVTNERFRHGDITETAEIVTVSHSHFDHSNVAAVKGNPQVVKDSGIYKDIKIKGIATAHDEAGGSERGPNIIFCFDVDGVNICHCGDLGHVLTETQVKAIGTVDVLMIPVGGGPTLDAATADKVIEQLKPKIILPMHYRTEKISFPLGVEDFIKRKNNVTHTTSSEIEIKANSLPISAQVLVLKTAL
jgi:L-ascorbate metabolism protein UlaG (beta-lactamase superfamily)